MKHVCILAAVLLILILAIGLLFLKQGRLDRYLPGLDLTADAVAESRLLKAGQEEQLAMNNAFSADDAQAELFALGDSIVLEDPEAANSFYESLQRDPEAQHFYFERTLWEGDNIELQYCDQEFLSLMPYFPNLRQLRLHNGPITDLTVLENCTRLEQVIVSKALFPMTIPEGTLFSVLLD